MPRGTQSSISACTSITIYTMQPYSHNIAFEWIRSAVQELLASNNPDWKGNFVSHLLPRRFEAYAKVLHSIEANYKNIDGPLSDPEIALLKLSPCKKLRSFIENLRVESRGPRIRWQTLAQLFGVPFESAISPEWFRARMEARDCWPRFLFGPGDGTLNHDEVSEMVAVLDAFTGGQDCFFRFAEMHFITTDTPILFRGRLRDLPTFSSTGKYHFTPEYWWPADHSWCLCSDYDLTFSIVGGSRQLIGAILNNATVEALEVTPETRIDWRAPMPNAGLRFNS
jgi:hypothetical protein